MIKILKCALVVLVGFSPVLLGIFINIYILNHTMMMTFSDRAQWPGGILIGAGVIVIWFFLGALFAKFLGNKKRIILWSGANNPLPAKFLDNKKQALILLNAPALLFLMVYPTTWLVYHTTWLPIPGTFGYWFAGRLWLATQFFYLPTSMIGMYVIAIAFAMKVGSSALGIKLLGGRR